MRPVMEPAEISPQITHNSDLSSNSEEPEIKNAGVTHFGECIGEPQNQPGEDRILSSMALIDVPHTQEFDLEDLSLSTSQHDVKIQELGSASADSISIIDSRTKPSQSKGPSTISLGTKPPSEKDTLDSTQNTDLASSASQKTTLPQETPAVFTHEPSNAFSIDDENHYDKAGENSKSVGSSQRVAMDDEKTNSTPSPPEQISSRKPVKFTVRKVSREGDLSSDEARERSRPITHRYGNLPQNKILVNERKSGDKSYQLKQNQMLFDEYVTRADKIEKEIQFLKTLLPPYNVEIDYATRSKISRAIEKLESKKDETEKKKYELGMSISRLWRDFDDNNTWVRSVSEH